TLADIGKRLGRKALEKVAQVAKPDTILVWYRRLIAQKFDGSKRRSYPGRPRIDATSKPSSCAWPRRTPAGVTTGSLARWPTSAITSRTRLWATSCVATTPHRLPNGVRPRRGKSSSAGIWTCSPEPISSPSKCCGGGGAEGLDVVRSRLLGAV